MRTTAMNSLTVGLWAILAGPASAYWRMSCPGRLVAERADPVVSPGEVSSHVHTISGGSGFDFAMTYQDGRNAKCSSCPIKEDLSNYWTPKLYYHAQNGSVISVPQAGDGFGVTGGMTVYYQQRPGPNNDRLRAFPPGFRMVAGDPFKRQHTNDFASDAVSFACLDYNGPPTPETHVFPTRNCPSGLRVQIYFPSCWDGQNLDSPDHKSHMSYPASGSYDNGPCPASHPVHLISIFYEVIYQTNLFADQWYGGSQPFVFAQGDATGQGMHGDFVNAWDPAVLQAAVDDCTSNSGAVEDCPHFSFFSDSQCHACVLPNRVAEPVDGVLPRLPGCNPITSGPAAAPPITTCPAAPPITPGHGAGPGGLFTDLTKSKGWRYVGCGADDIADRTLTGASSNDDSMTVERCVASCTQRGFAFAGLEYATECYCGNTLRADRRPQPGVVGNCMMPCKGDAAQKCGGGGAMSIYHRCRDTGKCFNAKLFKRDAALDAELDAEAEVMEVVARSPAEEVVAVAETATWRTRRSRVHARHGAVHGHASVHA